MKNPRSRYWYAAIAVLVFVFVDQYNHFLKLIGWKRFISESVSYTHLTLPTILRV